MSEEKLGQELLEEEKIQGEAEVEEEEGVGGISREDMPTEGTLLWYFYRKYYMVPDGVAGNKNASQHLDKVRKTLWKNYYQEEKKVYKAVLANVDEEIRGTVAELAERFGVEPMMMAGILDGMDTSLKEPNDVKNLTDETPVHILVEPETLFANMIDAGADWLYHLPEWEGVLSEERRKEILGEKKGEKEANTVKVIKVGRNDPCPCGSGKKYKYCHGRNA